MRLMSHAANIVTHSLRWNADKTPDFAYRKLTEFNQSAHRASRDAAKLRGHFVKRPEQHRYPLRKFSDAKHCLQFPKHENGQDPTIQADQQSSLSRDIQLWPAPRKRAELLTNPAAPH
jgi:hypothetical protein